MTDPTATRDADLERRLRDLAAVVEWPATPPLATGVRARLQPRRIRVPWWRRPLAVAAIAVAAAAAALAGLPQTRTAIAGWLGLRGVSIERVQHPSTPPTPPSATASLSIGDRLELGTRTTLTEAQARAGFAIAVPAALGAPDEVYVRVPPSGGAVSLVYLPRPGLPQSSLTGVGALVTEFRGEFDPQFLGKLLGPGTTADPVVVNGGAGFWIAGAPHELFYRDAAGQTITDLLRLAGNVLLWERGTVTIRLEAGVDEATALTLGRSVS